MSERVRMILQCNIPTEAQEHLIEAYVQDVIRDLKKEIEDAKAVSSDSPKDPG